MYPRSRFGTGMNRREFLRLSALFGAGSVAAALSGCAAPGPTTPPPTAAPQPKAAPAKPAQLEKVTIRVDWFADGYHAPLYVAREKGWYSEAGLDVEILEGKGSGNVAQLVGTKNDTFGFAEGGAVAKAIGQGIPVKMVAGIFRKTPLGLSYLEESGIKAPKDLEGKTYGTVPASASHALWPAFVAANNVDTGKIREVNIEPANADTLMLTRKIDFTDAFGGAEVARYESQGKKGGMLMYGDYGLNVVGHGIIANNDTIKEKPETIKKFVQASLKGWEYAKGNTEEAITILRKYVPERNPQTALHVLKVTLALLESPNTKGKPLGWQSDKDWQSTIDALAKHGGFSGAAPKITDVFTNDFIPNM